MLFRYTETPLKTPFSRQPNRRFQPWHPRIRKTVEAVEKLFWALNEDHRAADRSIKTSKSSCACNNGSIKFRRTAAIPTLAGVFQQLQFLSVYPEKMPQHGLARLAQADVLLLKLLQALADAAAVGATIVEYGALSPDPTPFPLFSALKKGLEQCGAIRCLRS